MRRRHWITWLVFALGALLVVDVLGWATWRVLRLERAERLATARADAGRRERLALWQMDSLVSAIVARESARPYFVYRPRFAADRPYDRAWAVEGSSAVRPSPLASGTGDPLIRLHYQIEPDRGIISPQAGGPVVGAEIAAQRPERLRAARLLRELDSARGTSVSTDARAGLPMDSDGVPPATTEGGGSDRESTAEQARRALSRAKSQAEQQPESRGDSPDAATPVRAPL